MDQRHHDASAGCANGVAQRASAAVDVDDAVIDVQLGHQGHGHHGESLVDFPQIHIGHIPARFGQRFLRGADGGGGEPVGFLRMQGVGDDFGQWLAAELLSRAGAHHHQGGCAVVDGGAGGCGDRAVFFEGGLERRDFVELCFERAFVHAHHRLACAGFDGDGRDFGVKRARFRCRLSALHAGNRESILRFARKLVFVGAFFAKRAHGAAGFISIFQAVEHHVVIDAVMADADAGAALQQQMRRIRHALHTACDHHVRAASGQHVMSKHRGAHTRATHFGQRDCARSFGQSAFESGLASRRLALARHQAVAKQHFVHAIGRNACALHGGFDRGSAQIMRGERGEIALKSAHGGAHGRNDDDGVLHVASSKSDVCGFKLTAKRHFGDIYQSLADFLRLPRA